MSDFLQQLIDAEKTAMAKGPAMDSTWRALESSLAAGLPAPVDVPLPAAGAATAAWLAPLLGGVTVLGVVAYVATRPPEIAPPPPPPPPVAAPAPAPAPPPPPVVDEAPPPKPKKRRPRRPKPASLAEQLRALRPAQAALAQKDYARALDVVKAHRQSYPKTPLDQERSAIEAIARCEATQSRARRVALRFLRRWPRSPQAERVRAACGLADPDPH